MTLLSAVVKLLLVMDPIGNAVYSVQLLKDVKGSRRRFVILRESLIALGILFVFLVGGRYLLDAVGIRKPALAIAGGVVMFLIALRMIFMPKEGLFPDHLGGEPLVVPIATPMLGASWRSMNTFGGTPEYSYSEAKARPGALRSRKRTVSTRVAS